MTTAPPHRIALLRVTAAGVLLAHASGCGPSVSSVCDAICDCQECTRYDYEDCVDDADDVVRKAEQSGCSDQVDGYLRCVDASLQCVDGQAEVPNCDIESDDLGACANAVPPFASSCDAGVKKLEECLGVTVDPAEVDDCTGAVQCTLRCYADATCEDLKFGRSMKLNDCLSSCPVRPGPGTDDGGRP